MVGVLLQPTTKIHARKTAAWPNMLTGAGFHGGKAVPRRIRVRKGGVWLTRYSTPTATLSGGGASAPSGPGGSGTPSVGITATPGGYHSGNLGYAWARAVGSPANYSYSNTSTATPTASYAFTGVPNGSSSSLPAEQVYAVVTDLDTGAQWKTDPITVGPFSWTNTTPAYSGRQTDYDGGLGSDASGTDTIDANASQVIIEVWGGGGSGQRNNNACTPVRGGASGSYARTVLSLSPSDWGKTISWFAGRAAPVVNSGNSVGFDGTASSVSSGSFGLTTMNAPGGTGGATALQGSATGGNTVNSAGNLGGLPAGGAAVAAVSGPGSGNGGAGRAGPTGTSFQGAPGRVRFTYSP